MTSAERIGRYVIQGEVGRGAMGVVFRATDPAIGRTVAIKTIRLTSATPEERASQIERLRREAQSGGRLSHPNIIVVFDFIEADESAFVCMELVEGPSLETVLAERRPLTREFVLSVLHQSAAALDYAHSRGVVHRDVKPANLLIHETSGLLKVSDFGIAKIVTEDATLTAPMLGTPNYISPEQVQSKPVGGRSDQFSLAVIAYELLTGSRPFAGYSVASIVYKVCNEPPPPASRLNRTLAPGIDAIFSRALAKDPALRFPTAGQMVDALEGALAAIPNWTPQVRIDPAQAPPTIAESNVAPSPPVLTPSPLPPPPPPKRNWIWMAGLALLMAVLAAWVGLRNDRRPAHPASAVEPSMEIANQEPTPALAEPAKPSPGDAANDLKGDELRPEPTPPSQAEPPLEAISVSILSTPSGATVEIDNIPSFTCVTPCSLSLAAGRHTLKAKMGGYRSALLTAEVGVERDFRLTLERQTGTVMAKSNPAGATILVDGREWPSRTPTMLTLPTGRHILILKKEGFRDEESEVVVRDGAVSTLEVNWQY